MLSDAPQAIHLEDYRPPEFLVDQVALAFELDEDETRVSARLEVRRNPHAEAPEGVLHLDGERLELLDLRLDGTSLGADAYSLDDKGLRIPGVPERFTLDTAVRIRPQDNTELEGLYRSGGMFCTQCEAEGFRRITYFPDRPDVMARFTTSISADRSRYPVLLSNGNRVSDEDLGDGRHRVRWVDPFPKPSYLFALVAGDLRSVQDRYTTVGGREVELRIYVEPENLDKCEHAMRSLKNAMRWDEQHYGREYDLDVYMIVAVNDFNMGAMENKGLNIFNSRFVLARSETATDRDFQGIEGVIAHEYFHNWTGNRITCRDWFQLSLKEGLTVFRDQEFSADMGSRGVKRIEDVRALRAHQFAEDSGPMAHPVRPESYIEINNFYTTTVYEKGAEVVRMQANLLGPETFRRATDLYFQRYDGQAVTTDDFVQCMADASGRDLSQFKRWYQIAGTPELEVQGTYDPAAGTYTLAVRQHTPDTPGQTNKPPLHIPFAVGLLDPEGRDLPLQLHGEPGRAPGTRMLELREAETRFTFVNLGCRPVPSLLRGFSAPVNVHYDHADQELMFLMSHDSDDFNRWDAAQTLSQRVILGLIEARRLGRAMQLPEGFVQAFRTALLDRTADRDLLTQVLNLPGESYLGDQMERVDVEGIHAAREAVRDQLGEALRQELVQVMQDNRETGAYATEPEDIGRRALKNLCLGYLMQRPDEQAVELCLEQIHARHNMTDVIGALSLVAHSDAPQRENELQAFAEHWSGDPLVMDKWFAIQAYSKRPDTLQKVEALMRHPAFSLRNPNKVRSLIGAFCAGNQVRFHAGDGSGYRFLADRVLELDPLNPQVASRMLRTMARWRRYDEARQGLMRAQLQRILAAPRLSRDVYEIASKSLEVA
jgi:aminopeptidase N